MYTIEESGWQTSYTLHVNKHKMGWFLLYKNISVYLKILRNYILPCGLSSWRPVDDLLEYVEEQREDIDPKNSLLSCLLS